MTRAAHSIPPADALLCESCGYPIDGLPSDGACPECGRAIHDSLPETRTGSAWQSAPRTQAWFETNRTVLRHPLRAWRMVAADALPGVSLAIANCFIAALIAFLPTSVLIWRGGRLVDALLALMAAVAVGGITFFVLTVIERFGIEFFGRSRGWRITPNVAWAVCGHATAGWLICGVLISGAMIYGALSGYSWLASVQVSAIVLPAPRPPAIVAIGAFLVGMLIFETLVYAGFRAMRFANHPREETNEPAAESELPSDQ